MKCCLSGYRSQYKAEVIQRLGQGNAGELLTLEDIAHLPGPVQKYLVYAGAPGMPKVRTFRAQLRGSGNYLVKGEGHVATCP